jgi:very-short-patch-repair endonuclease
MVTEAKTLQVGRERIARVFRYLKALNEHRNPAKRNLSEQPWSLWISRLPNHPAVRLRGDLDEAGEEGDFVLKVGRPTLTDAPEPPAPLFEWLEGSWEDPYVAVAISETRQVLMPDGRSETLRFDADGRRVEALERWRTLHDRWVQSERPARAAMHFFEKLYELHGRMEREAERIELILGDGILSWKRPHDSGGSIFHPILLQRIQLEFNPGLPEFTLVETGRECELYSALFRSLPEIEPKVLARCREELTRGGFHPLGRDDTSEFLRRLVVQLSPRGQFVTDGTPDDEPDDPQIGRSPVLFLRPRTLGFATALESTLEDLPRHDELSPALLKIVGLDPSTEAGEAAQLELSPGDEPESLLLSKPANPEQISIAVRLDQAGCVLVQGPPGTGKTHTIANLIGHLLAEGQSVLVTSHTTKALRVLRHHVVEPLRPLCVSVLESDLESRNQLENAVTTIVERLATGSPKKLETEAAESAAKRAAVFAELRQARQKLLAVRAEEYREIVVGETRLLPADAARKVTAEAGAHTWLPTPVMEGVGLPLSLAELEELYRANAELTLADEAGLAGGLPDGTCLPSPTELEQLVDERARLSAACAQHRADLWEDAPVAPTLAALDEAASLQNEAVALLDVAEPWKRAAIAAGRAGGPARESWDKLIELVGEVQSVAVTANEARLQHAPLPAETFALDEQLAIVEGILGHLADGRELGVMAFLAHGDWKRFIAQARVAEGEPRTVEHFRALQALLLLQRQRRELVARWDRQMQVLGAPSADELGPAPEEGAAQFCDELRHCLGWHMRDWVPFERALEQIGFHVGDFLAEQPPVLDGGELGRLRRAADEPLAAALRSRRHTLALSAVDAQLAMIRDALTTPGLAPVATQLRRAVENLDVDGYRAGSQRLSALRALARVAERRQQLLTHLGTAAPAWASAIAARRAPHAGPGLPGDPVAAWTWLRLREELDRRGRISLPELQTRVDKLAVELRRATAELIEKKAWAAQVRRTTSRQQQALVGWLDIVRRIGKGMGKRVPRLILEASQRMTECRSAVPVWIMPLARAVETFEPSTRFDVVITDEASQSDVMALIAFYMAKRVVVVGDHEQVSPSAVGQDLVAVQQLIDEHLEDIPNAVLYDGQMSIYDLARQSFGGAICLTEHFRCVPDIIEFSNHLCYDGKIRPLRDPSKAPLRPHVIAHHVSDGRAVNDTNPTEALVIASLIKAATEQPEYRGKSFGVISLVGDEQALEIERLLLHHLPPAEYEARRILCGNPAQFQGDERDIMFLSVVDTAEAGPLRMRSEPMFKQRFNVAASRARDQMWVIHSLDPADLKPRDLRARLIQHAENPTATRQLATPPAPVQESELVHKVHARLFDAGYRVHANWRVGYYTIDLVVEGGAEQRLAVECDGDWPWGLDRLREDVERQAILERLGWSFVRVRASEFYRAPEPVMEALFARLGELKIRPQGREPAATAVVTATAAEQVRARVVARAEELRRQWIARSQARLARAAAVEEAERKPRAAKATAARPKGKAATEKATKATKPAKVEKTKKPAAAKKPVAKSKPPKRPKGR